MTSSLCNFTDLSSLDPASKTGSISCGSKFVIFKLHQCSAGVVKCLKVEHETLFTGFKIKVILNSLLWFRKSDFCHLMIPLHWKSIYNLSKTQSLVWKSYSVLIKSSLSRSCDESCEWRHIGPWCHLDLLGEFQSHKNRTSSSK